MAELDVTQTAAPLTTHFPLLASGLAALAIFCLVVGLGRTIRAQRRTPLDRLALTPNLAAAADLASQAYRSGAKPNGAGTAADHHIDEDLRGAARFTGRLESELRQAGLTLTGGEFLLMIGILVALGLLVSWWAHNPLLAIVWLVGAYIGPRRWLRWRLEKRARDFAAQLPAMVEYLASSMRSGKSLHQSIEMAARELTPPMSIELRRVSRNVQILSGGMEEALLTFADEIGSEDLELIVDALTVQLRAGGDIAHMLDRIGTLIRDRVTLKAEVQSLTAQQRFSGIVLSLMPVVLAVGLLIFNPKYLLGVFATTQWCGWAMFSIAAVMIVAGILVMRRTVEVKI